MVEEIKPGFCTLCRSRCGTLNTVRDGRLIEVRPDPSHPTGRSICPKGRAAPEIVHSTRRLQTPLRRTRPKGEADPCWREISWNEALDEIAARLGSQRARHGAESVAFAVTSPSGTPLSDSIEWIERFIRLYGSPNICYATEICNWHKDFAHAFTFGSGIGTPDYANADLILLWGHNPANTWLSRADVIARAHKRGARLMVVDPRRTGHAAQADHWLRVRPGTDCVLALGLARRLIETNGFDRAFIKRWTNGPLLVRTDNGLFVRSRDLDPGASTDRYLAWSEAAGKAVTFDPANGALGASADDLALRGSYRVAGAQGAIECRPAFDLYAQACAPYDPARVAAITSVPESKLLAAADALASAIGRVSYYAWTGIGQHADATQTERAIAVLYALTGSVDAQGGNLFLDRQPANNVNPFSLLPENQRRKALGLDQRPLGPPSQGWVTAKDLCTAVLDGEPYPVRTLFGFGANLLVSQAGTERVRAALEKLDFHVQCDLFMTPTAQYADIVLPVNSPWEHEGLRVGFEVDAGAEELIQLRQRMVPPRGESRSDSWIVFELARRLGMSDEFFDCDMDKAWDHVLKPLGLTVDKLRSHPSGLRRLVRQTYRKYALRTPRGPRGFATETRRVEIYSELLRRHGHPPVPEPAPGAPAGTREFPLLLTTAKSGYFCHSQQRSLPSLRRRALEPEVAISAQLARRERISAGQWVVVRTPAGQARFRARIDEFLDPAVVVADYGWWQPCQELGLSGYPIAGVGSSNFNRLIDPDHSDPLSGSVAHRAAVCTLEPERHAPAPWPDYRSFRVAGVVTETADTRSLELVPADAGPLPAYRPGQHVGLRIRGQPGHDALTRNYSLSAAPESDQSSYRITVKRIGRAGRSESARGGAVSSYIHQRLQPGDIVDLQAPRGAFLLPVEPDFPVVLIAGGIGITPFIGYLEALAAKRSTAEMLLLYGNRKVSSHAFRSRLVELSRALPQLTVRNYYSRANGSKAYAPDRRGRIHARDVDQHWIDRRARFYLCGPPAMLRDLAGGLQARGVPRFEIFQEAFWTPPASTTARKSEAYEVHFAQSGRKLKWQWEHGSLLEFAEACGVDLPSGCRVGQCESCAVRVLEGEVGHLTSVHSDDDAVCLSCQAIPMSDLVIDA